MNWKKIVKWIFILAIIVWWFNAIRTEPIQGDKELLIGSNIVFIGILLIIGPHVKIPKE